MKIKWMNTLWKKLSDDMPDSAIHPRVLVYTEGADFDGEQFFDVKTDTLYRWDYDDPNNQPDVCACATHWMPLPMPEREFVVPPHRK